MKKIYYFLVLFIPLLNHAQSFTCDSSPDPLNPPPTVTNVVDDPNTKYVLNVFFHLIKDENNETTSDIEYGRSSYERSKSFKSCV